MRRDGVAEGEMKGDQGESGGEWERLGQLSFPNVPLRSGIIPNQIRYDPLLGLAEKSIDFRMSI